MSRVRKAINFDLDTKMLRNLYPSKNWRKAYKDIKEYMKINGFTHRQWSGYISNEPLSYQETTKILQRLVDTYEWAYDSIRIIDMSDLSNHFDVKKLIHPQRDPEQKLQKSGLLQEVPFSEKAEPEKVRRPMREVFAEAQKATDEYNAKLGIRPSSRDDLEL